MKKALVCFLTLILSMSLIACSDGGNSSSTAGGDTTVNSSQQSSEAEVSDNSADYDWTNVFASMDLENPFRVRFTIGSAPISCATGAVAHLTNDVVTFVDYNSEYAESDFGIDVSQATSPDKIVKTFEKTFSLLVQYDVTALTNIAEPHIEIETQDSVKINNYDMSRSTGHYYYYPMFSQEGDNETALYFVTYATFLSDGTPVYIAAVDASEDQSKKDFCDQVAEEMIKTLEEIDKSELI